jgi:hypothetical protein
MGGRGDKQVCHDLWAQPENMCSIIGHVTHPEEKKKHNKRIKIIIIIVEMGIIKATKGRGIRERGERGFAVTPWPVCASTKFVQPRYAVEKDSSNIDVFQVDEFIGCYVDGWESLR